MRNPESETSHLLSRAGSPAPARAPGPETASTAQPPALPLEHPNQPPRAHLSADEQRAWRSFACEIMRARYHFLRATVLCENLSGAESICERLAAATEAIDTMRRRAEQFLLDAGVEDGVVDDLWQGTER